ncbi:MAG: hypothetical protein JNJ41_06630 [Bacteroidia bacterium]|nr:hypothetical protein [Bacteroidia bacterium]
MTFVIMFIHMVYNNFNFIRIPSLKGYIANPEKPLLNDSNWFSGHYQVNQENYLNSNFGFRSLYVRLNNQIDFSVFNKIHSQDVVLGKDNYLFEERYINSYCGKDFMGADSVEHILDQLAFISSEFKKRGKHLIIVFAANKASYYPEFIPEHYHKINDSTNYKFLSTGIKNKALNAIDFDKWFVENRSRAKYPLYPKYGTHWSNYGAVLAADSIINYIQALTSSDLPNLIYDKIDLKQPIYTDYDIADGMNLLFRLKSFEMAYPKISTENAEGKTRPRVLVISDSFYWDMFYFGISKSFKDDHFWYYNKQVYPESNKKSVMVKELDLEKEIEKHDVFVVMATSSNLNGFGWGFFDNVEILFKSKNADQIREIRQSIKGDNNWMEQIEQKAKARGISADSMLTTDALWLMQQSKKFN